MQDTFVQLFYYFFFPLLVLLLSFFFNPICFCTIVFVMIYGAFIYNYMEQQCQRVAAWDKCSWICLVVKPLGLTTSTHRIIEYTELEGNHKDH